MGVQIPQGEGAIFGVCPVSAQLKSIGSLCIGVCKNDRTDPDAIWGLTLVATTNHVLYKGQGWMNPFATTRSDKTETQPFVKVLWSLVIVDVIKKARTLEPARPAWRLLVVLKHRVVVRLEVHLDVVERRNRQRFTINHHHHHHHQHVPGDHDNDRFTAIIQSNYVSWHTQLTMGPFCCSRVLQPACHRCSLTRLWLI